MVKKHTVPDLTIDQLKTGRVYRSKKPKLVGSLFNPLVNDRQILYISAHKAPFGQKELGYNPAYIQWCKDNLFRIPDSYLNQLEFEKQFPEQNAKLVETIWDYSVQYDSPSVKFGQKHPSIQAEKFIKWAQSDVTDILPKNGDWASEIKIKAQV